MKNLLGNKMLGLALILLAMAGIIFITAAPAMPAEPLLGGFIFQVESSQADGTFREVAAINTESEVIESKVAGTKGATIIRKLPGRLKITSDGILLRRLASEDMSFYVWRKMVEDGKIATARTNVNLKVLSSEGDPVMEFELSNAWPTKLDYSSDGSDGFTETVWLTCEGVRRLK